MFLYAFVVVIIVRILILILKAAKVSLVKLRFNRKTKYKAGLFLNNFVDSRALFMLRFNQVPSIMVVTQVYVNDVYAYITEKMKEQIVDIHQANMFDHSAGKPYFNVTIVELTNKRMIELGNGYVEVFYTRKSYDWAETLIKHFASYQIETDVMETKTPTVIGFARAFEMN